MERSSICYPFEPGSFTILIYLFHDVLIVLFYANYITQKNRRMIYWKYLFNIRVAGLYLRCAGYLNAFDMHIKIKPFRWLYWLVFYCHNSIIMYTINSNIVEWILLIRSLINIALNCVLNSDLKNQKDTFSVVFV